MIELIRNAIDNFLRIPELKGLENEDFDNAEVTAIQRKIFNKKEILQILYREYCRPFVASAERAQKSVKMIEIGSGSSPLKDKIPNLICTDLVNCEWLDLSCSAYALPFKDCTIDRIFLMFVCHHLGRVKDFLDEVYRCLKPGGEVVIIDPSITIFSKFYYKYMHVDSMELQSNEWGFKGGGRLSDSNIALMWIIFFRDRERFKELYPELVVERVEYSTCLAFLLSGGVRIKQLLPTFVLKILFNVENWIIRHITSQISVTMVLTIKRL